MENKKTPHIEPKTVTGFIEALEAPAGKDLSQGAARARKPARLNENIIISNTKMEKAIFNPRDKDYIRASGYDGSAKKLATGPEGKGLFTQLQLELSKETFSFNEMTMAEKAEQQLTKREHFWLTAIQSIVHDNPDENRIYGSDILKRWGWQNPHQESSGEVMTEAARALERMTVLKMALDTTGEKEAYGKHGKIVKNIQFRPIVDGLINLTIEEDEDGTRTRDFYIDLRPDKGKDATNALPTYEYALSKGQLKTVKSSLFDFSAIKDNKGSVLIEGVRGAGVNHRLMMAYIYDQLKTQTLSNTVLFSTMFETLDLELNKDTKYKASNMLEKLLNNWQARDVIGAWSFKYKGKTKIGIVITNPGELPSAPKNNKKRCY